MATWSDALQGAIKSFYCGALSNGAAFYDYFLPAEGGFVKPPPNAFRNFYREACNREPPQTPPRQSPQGQCAGVQYDVASGTASYRDPQGNAQTTQLLTRGCPTGLFGPAQLVWRNLGSGSYAVRLTGFTSDGVTPFEIAVSSIVSIARPEDALAINGQLKRCDNQPDNCGTPVVPPPPPGYNQGDTIVNYTDNNGTNISVPVNIKLLAPVVLANGEINIPVSLVVGDPTLNLQVPLDANFNLSTGGISFNVGGSNGNDSRGSDCKPTPDDYGTPSPTPSPTPAEKAPVKPKPADPTTEQIIRGVIVVCRTTSGNDPTVIFGTNGPDQYFPDLGLIWFLCRTDGNNTAWLGGTRVQTLRQLIPCDWPGGAIDVKFNPRNGVLFTLTPIYLSSDVPSANPGAA